MPSLRRPPPNAKVTRPRPGAGLLVRPRLHSRLHAADALWIGAPPASGKTVLAASAIDAAPGAALWYQIDSGDADPAACFHFLGQAAADLPGRRPALPRPGRETGAELDDFARAWFRTLFASLSGPLTLVFDDWHRLPLAHPLQRVLPDLLDERPAGVRLWLISREAPPPRLDAARLAGRLQALGPADLALTVDETQALLDRRSAAPRPGLGERWHRWCDGWVGALVFALAAGRDDPADAPATAADMAPVFGVLAREVVDQATPALRDFMLATAWAPFVTEALARRLLPGHDVAALLGQLVQRQLLIPVQAGRSPGWRYHHLLRQTLQDRARRSQGEAALHAQLTQTALALDDAGLPEPAAPLLIEARQWPLLARLLLRQATQLLQQGRYGTVAAWAEALPDDQREPWVDFHWAGALLPRDARLGQQRYEQAWAGFWAAGDAEGLYRSWCGVIEGATFACDDYGVLERWLGKLRELRQRFPRFPSLMVRAQVAVYGFSASFFLHPRPPEFGPWLRGVQRLYRFAPRRGDRAAIGALLGLHHAAHGGMGALGAHLHSLRPLLDDPAVPPFHRLVGGLPDVIHHWIAGSPDDALVRLAVYEQLARHTGAHAIDTQFAFQSVYVHCIRGDLVQADVQLQRIAPRLAQLGRLDEAQYRVLLGWRAALAGRLDEAQRLLHEAVDDTRRRRFAFLEAVARGLLGELLAMAGQAEAARTMADQALGLARQMDSVTAEVPCAVARAAVAEWTDEPAEQRDRHLADALAAVRRHGHWAWGGLFPPTLARLMQRALQRGIEADTARELIRRRRLPPPAAADGSWPWPLRLRAFGELQLWVDDQPIGRGGGKASQRPLDLLRALLAQAPRPLPVHLALQWIWGDADATDQRKAFDVALLRARRLLGDDKGDDSLLRLEGGQLSFDSARVWTDVDALLALADRVGAADADPACAVDWAAQLLDLARGPLLPDDESPWVRTARERLRRRCAATAERLSAWLTPAQPALARELLQRSFDNDPASEPLARQLASALAATGDRREACRVLELCQATRALTGEAPVGSQTRALFERLQG